jgi:subfamily B ATP-binding cassette protein MsbA
MRVYSRALAYFRRDRARIVLLLTLIAFSIGLGLLQAWPTAVLLDVVLTPNPKQPSIFHRIFLAPLPDNRLAQVIGVALIGMFLKIAQDSITTLRVMLNNRLKYNGVSRARAELFGKLHELDIGYHRSRPQGDAIYRLSNDVFGFFGILDTFIAVSVAGITLTVMVWIMVWRNASITAFALSITPLMIWTNLHFGRTIKARTAESKRIDTDFTTLVQRAMSTVGIVQLFGRQKLVCAHHGEAVDRSVVAWMRMNWQEQLYPLTVNLIYALGGAIVFGYGGYLVWREQFAHPVANPTTIGDLTVIMGYLGGLWDPLKCLTGFSAAIQGHVAAAERVFDVLDREPLVRDVPGAMALALRPRTLALRHVAFSYREDRPILTDVSATIAPGEMVAFIGPSGMGKSTLLNLLPRLYDPTSGAILLDGIDLRKIRLADVRRHIALVPQENPMLAASITENIAFGHSDATMADVLEAAELAGAAEFIDQMPEGYDTQLVDGGANLSGGQRQRIAIARALLTEAPILVMDEPTSALDSGHEQLLLQTLRKLKGQRTIILVIHRLDTIEDCDRVFVLENGKIAQKIPTAATLDAA